MNYFIIKKDDKNIDDFVGHWGFSETLEGAQNKSFKFETEIIESEIAPEKATFKYNNNSETWEVTERVLSATELKALQNWEGLEDDLELTILEDSLTDETFFQRAFSATNTPQGAGAYALLMNCFGANKWDNRLGPALQLVKNLLPVPLTENEVTQLNTILSNRGFQITIN